jgi:hypothetical protein
MLREPALRALRHHRDSPPVTTWLKDMSTERV